VAELIVTIIFVISVLGIVFISSRKAPALVELPQNGKTVLPGSGFAPKIQEKINSFLLVFKRQIFLHKILSWVRVLTLKVESKIDSVMHGIRKNAQKIDKELKDKK